MERTPARFWKAAAAGWLFRWACGAQSKAARSRHAPKPAGRGQSLELVPLGLGVSGILLIASSTLAEPFLPRDGGQVLEALRTSASDSGARELRGLRVRLGAEPNNLSLASQYVRGCIERSRNDADPRYLGRAQAALAPWWNAASAPADALVLRATIRQAQHDFTNALSDLDLALNQAPRNAQAWLTQATILTVLSDYTAARHACLPLAQLAPGLVALTAAASVSCLDGDAERGCALLRNALDAYPQAATPEKIWALTVLGETSTRLGRQVEAEDFFKHALELDARDTYSLCAYADLLLDEGRAEEAAGLLKDGLRTDAVLLRLALAESQLKPKPESLATHVSTLAARFEAGHLRGDFVHQREEARFVLCLLGKAREALRLAQENWRVQREPADVRILLESALAAHDLTAARPALEFVRSSHLQDVRLQKLVEALNP